MTKRIYTDHTELTDGRAVTCSLCKFEVVPKGLSSTRYADVAGKHCPNCGHVFYPIRPANPAEGMTYTMGTYQVEYVKIVVDTAITTEGKAKVTFTGKYVPNGSKVLNVDVAKDDVAEDVTTKIFAALKADTSISGMYNLLNAEVAGDSITAIPFAPEDTDATLQIVVEDGTCVGITKSTSTTTMAGVAPELIPG